jgi:TonB family protein
VSVQKLILFFSLACVLAPVLSAQTAGPQPTPGRKFRVSQGVAEKNVIAKKAPHYPAEALAKHIQGDVILQGTIDHEGNVTGLKVVKGDPLLADAALEAVSQWKYKP